MCLAFACEDKDQLSAKCRGSQSLGVSRETHGKPGDCDSLQFPLEMPKWVAITSAVLSIKLNNQEINLVASVPLVFQINKRWASPVSEIEDSKSHMGLWLLQNQVPTHQKVSLALVPWKEYYCTNIVVLGEKNVYTHVYIYKLILRWRTQNVFTEEHILHKIYFYLFWFIFSSNSHAKSKQKSEFLLFSTQILLARNHWWNWP